MCRTCPEYQRLLRAYQRAFVAWGEPKKVIGNEAADVDLETLEREFRFLTEHQQTCALCSGALKQSVEK
jgi:hypothetical protein